MRVGDIVLDPHGGEALLVFYDHKTREAVLRYYGGIVRRYPFGQIGVVQKFNGAERLSTADDAKSF